MDFSKIKEAADVYKRQYHGPARETTSLFRKAACGGFRPAEPGGAGRRIRIRCFIHQIERIVIRLFFPEIHTEEGSFNFTERSIRCP